jgi:acetyl esterase/lipase
MTNLHASPLPSVSFFAGLVQGGAEKQAVETAKLLHRKGHRVVFYNYNLQKAFYHPEQDIIVVDIKNYQSPFPEAVDKVLSIFRLAGSSAGPSRIILFPIRPCSMS